MRNVFSNRTRLALLDKNLPIDIILESGARGHNHAFLNYYVNIVGKHILNIEVVPKVVPIFIGNRAQSTTEYIG